jgi:membrane peptidoglycan carboxypeptidase
MLALALFAIGLAVGYGWGLDRQIRGGILRQRVEERQRPDWTPVGELPSYIPRAFAAVVQPDLLHAGAVGRPERGTTVARELVRQVHLLPSSITGRAQEMLMGPVLARRLTPEALVELYLNRVALGRQQGMPVFGIWQAAHEYFGKDPRQLTLGETATLAGLLLPPRILDPASRVGAVGERRNEVLRVMLSGGLIDQAEYAAASAEPLGIKPGLDQMPMSRPADWGSPNQTLRLPPNLRPQPSDSTKSRTPAR